jgi:hypothetical protein
MDWIDVNEQLPTEEGYYDVKYDNGQEDSKPFRIRPSKNIRGFMTMENVTHWRESTDKQDFPID